jgi:hypothetical protein
VSGLGPRRPFLLAPLVGDPDVDIVELLGGMPGMNPPESTAASDLPKQEKMRLIVEKYFPLIWFLQGSDNYY